MNNSQKKQNENNFRRKLKCCGGPRVGEQVEDWLE